MNIRAVVARTDRKTQNILSITDRKTDVNNGVARRTCFSSPRYLKLGSSH